jgi:long-chain acyl-CoA synthetase
VARGAALKGDTDKPDVEAMAAGAAEQAILLSVPLFHVTGCHAIMLGSISFGGKLVIMYKWDPERALELIERERITTIGGVPAMVWQLLESPSFATTDISSVSSIGYGGAPAPPELVRRIEELFPGRTPTNGWGMTETSSTAASNNGIDYIQRPESCGPPLPVNDVRVVAEDGKDVPHGEAGELWVRGPNVVKGYWNKPEATADTFVEGGWLRTGDIARIDDDGFIYITDRAKDMIIRGGENIYSAEVEAALFEHPAVTDVAIFGIPHEVLGEEVAAVVVLKPGAIATAEELQSHTRDRVAAFKVPVRIWFWEEELPRNPAGKILKRELREQALARA